MAAAVMTDRVEARRSRRRAARLLAFRYALIYAAVAVIWIVLSDRILAWLDLPQGVESVVAAVKGIAFVVVTATLLLVLGLRYFRGLEASQERYTRLFENAVEGLTVFTVVRDRDGAVTDLELADMNPTQQERAGLTREEAVGRRLSRPDGLDERTRSYLEVVASAAGTGTSSRSELHIESEDAYELLEAYPVGRDRWALSALDISGVRHAERALRLQEESIRRAYVDVIDAVTGGKLILLTDEELAGQLGVPLMPPASVIAPRDLAEARAAIASTATERFPEWAPGTDVRTPVGEALVNALRHAGGGTYQVFAREATLQVLVRDEGPGIDFRTLPHATLQRGFSTESSLGMGFTIMLQVCERVLLSSRPGRTSVVLEFAARRAGRGEPGRPRGGGVLGRDAGAIRGRLAKLRSRRSARPHAVVARLVLDLCEPELLEHRRDVVGEPPAQSLLEAVPAADRVVRGPAPGLHGAFRRRLLLVGAAQRHPVACRDEHGVQVLDAAQVVAQFGLADDDDEGRRIGGLVAIRLVLRLPRRGGERPRVFARPGLSRALCCHDVSSLRGVGVW